MRAALAAAALALLALPAAAETIDVYPGEGTPLQDALDAALDGDTILVHRGKYRESLHLEGKSAIVIEADGKVTVDSTDAEGSYGLYIFDCAGVEVNGITFKGASNDGIGADDSDSISVRGCTFTGIGDSGIEEKGTTGHFIVEDCRFVNCSWGLALSYGDNAGTEGIVVRNCSFRKIGSRAIEFQGNGARIEENRISGSGEDGIRIRPNATWESALITGNRISRAVENGIELTGGSHVVADNDLRGCGIGILVDGDGDNVLDDNTVRGSKSVGIQLDSNSNTLTGNSVLGSREFDIASTLAEGFNVLIDNEFRKSSFAPDDV